MTGGKNAPSEGAPKITIESFCSSSAEAGDNVAAVISMPSAMLRASPTLFLTVPSVAFPPCLFPVIQSSAMRHFIPQHR
jgi:hypothetical protein